MVADIATRRAACASYRTIAAAVGVSDASVRRASRPATGEASEVAVTIGDANPAVAWLNAGVPPTQVAEWVGHSVNVLLRVYARCVYGQDEVATARIEAALALTAAVGEPAMAETSHRIPTQQSST